MKLAQLSQKHEPRPGRWLFNIESYTGHFARWSLIIVLVWIGAVRFTLDGAAALTRVLRDHAVLGDLLSETGAMTVARIAGALQITAAGLLFVGLWRRRIGAVGATLTMGLTALPMTLLFTNPVWMDSLGGFPAIGSGQGVIKYPALVGLAFFVYTLDAHKLSLRRGASVVMVAGVMLPLLWIGGMKFTAPEAAGIEPLLSSSPFMSWMPTVFGRQGASNLIGTVELGTAALLTTWWVHPRWYRWGALLTSVTFCSTLSFLITLPGWDAELGFPVLSGAGIFIIKDLGLLAAGVVPLSCIAPAPTNRSTPELEGQGQ